MKAITDDKVNATLDAVLANLAIEAYPLAGGYALDLNAAINARTLASLVKKDVHVNQRHKHHTFQTAILLARPVKG